MICSIIFNFGSRCFVTRQDRSNSDKRELVELCFLKNARRLVRDLSIVSRATDHPQQIHCRVEGVESIIAAPSVVGVSALFKLRILKRNGSGATSLQTEQGEMACRAAAVVASHALCASLNRRLVEEELHAGGDDSSTAASKPAPFTPMDISVYLDTVVSRDSLDEGGFSATLTGSMW